MNFTTKERNNVYEVTLRLPDIKYLFVAPEPDPFSRYYEEYSYTSGMEFIAGTFYADPTLRSARLSIQLPADKVRPGLEEETREAIRRYCGSRISYVEHEVRGLRWRSLRGLASGLVALVVFLGASKLASSSDSALLQLVGEGLGIAAWVAIWFPLDNLIFSVPQRSMDRDIYHRLMDVTVTIACE